MNSAAFCLLVWTLRREAGGEGTYGMTAVASVIWNRAGGSETNIERVIRKPKAFTCWRRYSAEKWQHVIPPPDAVTRAAEDIARDMAAGTFSPITRATHYHAGHFPDGWKKREMIFCTKIGRHTVWRELKPQRRTKRR